MRTVQEGWSRTKSKFKRGRSLDHWSITESVPAQRKWAVSECQALVLGIRPIWCVNLFSYLFSH